MSTQLYALIKRSSKYHDQHDGKEPFPIEISDWDLAYPIRGNNNNYRFADLNLYVKQSGWEKPDSTRVQYTPIGAGKTVLL